MSERSQIYPKIDGNDNQELISDLEGEFTNINQLLYTTSVPSSVLEEKVMPFIADDVIFKDPWQEGGDKNLYRIGMKGFHKMCNFTFDIIQIGVKLNKDGLTGRCMVDGVMLIQLLSFISFVYPLRSIIIYDFRLMRANLEDEPQFEIFRQEEMWSYADMIDGVPGVGWVYRNLFRPAFGHLFVAVSYLCCLLSDWFGGATNNKKHE